MSKALALPSKRQSPPPTFRDRLIAALDELQRLDKMSPEQEEILLGQIRGMTRDIALNRVKLLEPQMWATAPKDGKCFDCYAKFYDAKDDVFRFIRLADTFWERDHNLPEKGKWGGSLGLCHAHVRPLYWVRRLESDEIAELCTR